MKKIDKRYAVVRELGAGMSGEVLLVRDPKGRVMALKHLKEWQPGVSEQEALESFKREFSILKDLNHPNIARILDFGRDEKGRYYFTSEYVEGADFFQATRGKDPAQVEELIVQALRALEYLHSRRVYHLDIKPANLLVTNDGKVKLIDFGLAGEKFGDRIGGTPAYMAPEVIYGEAPDGRADLYSLGIVFYYSLAGSNPFKAASVQETLDRQKKFLAPSITKVALDTPAYLGRVLAHLLEKRRGGRYAQASHVIRDINLLCGRNYPIETSETLLSYLPEEGAFIGRMTETAKAQEICLRLKNRPERSSLWIRGPKGTGKTRFLKELKYFCQLNDLKVVLVAPGDPPPRKLEPTVFLLDDVDLWGEPDEESWFDFFQDAKRVPLVTLMTTAGEERPPLPLLQPLLAPSGSEAIDLKNFSQEELREYLVSLTGLDHPPEALVHALWERTEGNPLFVGELLKTLIGSGLLFDAQGRWRQATLDDLGVDFSKAAIPTTLQGLLERRFAEEAAGAQNLLCLLALLRRPIRIQDLPQLVLADSWEDDLTRLLQREWIVRDPRNPKTDEVELKNPLCIEVIEGLLKPQERETWHDRIADWLETLQDSRSDEAVARHRGEGSDPKAAVAALLPLAHAMLLKGSGAEAAPLFQRALDRLPPEATRERIDATLGLGEAYYQSDAFAESLETFRKIRPLLAKIENRDEDVFYKVDIHGRLASVALKLRRSEEAKEDIQAGLTLLTDYKDDPVRHMILENDLAQVWCQEGALDRAEEIFVRTDRQWRLLGEPDRLRVTNNDLGFLYLLKGDAEKAIASLQEQLEFCRRLSRRYPEARCHYNLAEAYSALKDYSRTIEHYERCLVLAREAKAYDLLLRAYNGLGNVTSYLAEKKDVDAGIEHYLRALAIAQKLEDESSQAAIHSNLGILYQEKHQKEDAEHHLMGAIRIVQSMKERSAYDLSYLARAYLELGSLLREKSDFEASRDLLRDAQSLIQEHPSLKGLRFWVLYEMACLYRDQGREDSFRTTLKDLRGAASGPEEMKKLRELDATAVTSMSLATLRNLARPLGFVLVKEGEVRELEEAGKRLKERLEQTESRLSLSQSLLQEESIQFQTRYSYEKIVTRSKTMRDLLKLLDRVTDTTLAVLIQGETGTGKELIARALHYNSNRKSKPFVAVNCGAIPSELMESELFGHKEGAFTGASRDKIGLCEAADGGTLFLDEIGELSPALQVKLLRFLQEKEFRRVGETETRHVDVRVISATHQNLGDRIREGRFREDLFFRISEISVSVPPLRERREDVPLLVESFLEACRVEMKREKKFRIDKALLRRMIDYDWPGNIRELENVVRVACALAEDQVVTMASLPAHSPLAGKGGVKGLSTVASSVMIDEVNRYRPGWTWGDYERHLIAHAYRHHLYRAIPTAQAVGITPPTIYRKIREWHLEDAENATYKEDFRFVPGTQLKPWQKRVFEAALRHHKRPYAALRALGVSQGLFYKVVK